MAKKKTKKKATKKVTKKTDAAQSKSGLGIQQREGSFVPGNQLWKKAKRPPGTGVMFKDPQELYDLCCNYFDECDENPLYSCQAVNYKGKTDLVDVPKMRPYTQEGLALFIGISDKTWRKMAKNEKKEDEEVGPYHEVHEVVLWANQVIRQQKYEGGMTGFFNASLIARDLGMSDKSTHVTEDEEGNQKELGGPVMILPSNGREKDATS